MVGISTNEKGIKKKKILPLVTTSIEAQKEKGPPRIWVWVHNYSAMLSLYHSIRTVKQTQPT